MTSRKTYRSPDIENGGVTSVDESTTNTKCHDVTLGWYITYAFETCHRPSSVHYTHAILNFVRPDILVPIDSI